jgi:moderate conductance mechanosensitive channel
MPRTPFFLSLAVQAGTQPASPSGLLSGQTSLDLQRILSALLVVGIELALGLLICGVLYVVTSLILSRVVAPRNRYLAEWSVTAQVKARNLLLVASFGLVAGTLLFNGWLLVRGLDARSYTIGLLRSITIETQVAIAVAIVKLVLAIAALVVATRLLRRAIVAAEAAINRWDQLKSNDESLGRLFRGLDRLIANTAWMLLAVFACGWFGLPQRVTDILLVAIRIYLVFSIGLLIIRCTAVAVDTLDGLSQRAALKRGWTDYYNRLLPLLPTFRTCLEYALWIAMGSLVLIQIDSTSYLASWGPRLIQAIGFFFLGRVVIELGSLEIGHRMLPREGLSDVDRRRRATMVPLVRSGFTYAAYFGTAVLILSALGFNPMPFLAGAGILGLVIGFGAQSMIDDVVSGFFILLENMYLVGDTIEVGPAKGVVEAIEFRTTKIRDADGRLHILRNGAIKPVINYSKDYTMAVVKVEVAYDADLRTVFDTLRAAGRRLRAETPDVLADTEIDGIIAFGPLLMTVRTSTRVKPGRHEAVEAALRLVIKEMFDRQATGAPRKTLVPSQRDDRQPDQPTVKEAEMYRTAG